MKLTFALILQWSEPDKELVEKYEGLKAVFFKRLVNAWEKAKDSIQPALERMPQTGHLTASPIPYHSNNLHSTCCEQRSHGSSRCLRPLSAALRWRTPGQSNYQHQASAGYCPAS
uniref:Uncharacterized protein n=1 Tax=Sinocyclocheilus anshuiensis TaxID=1608454 RepID=A0A671LTJ3_9TELE